MRTRLNRIPASSARQFHAARACVWVLVLATFSAPRNFSQQTAAPSDPPTTVLATSGSGSAGKVQQTTAKNKQTATAAQHDTKMANDSARLLKLAEELKAELGKTSEETLSIPVIRRASEIERLAHDARENTRLAAAANGTE